MYFMLPCSWTLFFLFFLCSDLCTFASASVCVWNSLPVSCLQVLPLPGLEKQECDVSLKKHELLVIVFPFFFSKISLQSCRMRADLESGNHQKCLILSVYPNSVCDETNDLSVTGHQVQFTVNQLDWPSLKMNLKIRQNTNLTEKVPSILEKSDFKDPLQ